VSGRSPYSGQLQMSLLRDWLYVARFNSGEGLRIHWRLLRFSRLHIHRVSLLAEVLRTIPPDVVESFRSRLLEKGASTKAGKYFDLVSHLARAVVEADLLGVINSKSRLRVLDLGTGCGYFPYVCRYLGHEIETLDKQEGKYGYARNQLGVPVCLWQMTPDNPLPEFDKQFDLITAFQPVFFMHQSAKFGRLWTPDLWKKFFSGIREALSHRGRFYLGANDLSRVDQYELRRMIAYFRENGGGRVSDGWIFDRDSL